MRAVCRIGSLIPRGLIVDSETRAGDEIRLLVRAEARVVACSLCASPSRVVASLASVQAYERDGGLFVRYGFKVPGEALPLSDGPFTPAGWAGKCVGRVVAAMRSTWQASPR